MPDRIRVGIVGSRFAAMLHAESYTRIADVDIVAVADPDEQARQVFAERYGIGAQFDDCHDMLANADLDLISACVPNYLHKDVVLACAAAKRHVICEKPLATSVADARQMVAACQQAGVRLFYAEDWFFAPSLRRARQIIDEGGIGRVLYIKAKETHNGTHSPFAQQAKYCGGGAMIHLGVHPLAWVVAVAGESVAEVRADATAGQDTNLVHDNYTGEDWAVALLRFPSGLRATIEANYITVGGMDDVVEIYGTEGVIKVEMTFGSPLRVYSRKGIGYAVEKADFTHGWTQPAVDEFESLGYVGEIAEFVDCVRTDHQPPAGLRGEDGVVLLELVQAIYEAIRTGQAVKPNYAR